MRNIVMLTLANLRKHKGQTVSLFIFVLIAAMMMNIGLVLFTGINAFFENKAEENHAAHFTGIYNAGVDSIRQGRQFMENDSRVREIEELNAVGGNGDYYIADSKTFSFVMFFKKTDAHKMDALKIVGDYKPLEGMNCTPKVGHIIKNVLQWKGVYFHAQRRTAQKIYGRIQTKGCRVYAGKQIKL